MPDFIIYVWNLFIRILAAMLQEYGKTVVTILSPLFIFGIKNYFKWRKGELKTSSLKDYKCEIVATLIVYGIVFIYFTGSVIYKDHQTLMSEIGSLKSTINDKDKQIVDLEKRLKTRKESNANDTSFKTTGNLSTATLIFSGRGIMGDISINTTNNCGITCYDGVTKTDDQKAIIWDALPCYNGSCIARVERAFSKGLYCEPTQQKNCTYNIAYKSR